jgi:hypothetical protein
MTHFLDAISFTPDVHRWLANTRQPRILHIFDRACNLINERREVLSIVTPQIGDGPFNLVVEGDVCFSKHLNLQSPVFTSPNGIFLGRLKIHTGIAKLWNPRPDWASLHIKRENIANQLNKFPITNCPEPGGLDTLLTTNARRYSTTVLNSKLPMTDSQSLISSLCASNLQSSFTAAQKLAGLGAGLTPAGDDFLMGAIYAAWIIHPAEIASVLAQGIANSAAPLTTSLSAAWLRSAGKGETGVVWHEFFDALISAESPRIQASVKNILAVGETSGTDALTGFMSTFSCSFARP